MVHSNGTRSESQRFRIDFTGSRKYSGFSCDFLLVSAGGEEAARRAMPTSGAAAPRSIPSSQPIGLWGICDSGGQSLVAWIEALPRWLASGARRPADGAGLAASGLSGK